MGPTLADMFPNGITTVTIRATYTHDPDDDNEWVKTGYIVYGWGVYPEGNVLAGQVCKVHLANFDCLDDALVVFPDADVVDAG